MEPKTNMKGIQATSIALVFCVIVYLAFSFLAFVTYGDAINPSIFQNIKNDGTYLSVIIRIMFLTIFAFNVPFLFLPAKENILVLIEEVRNKSMSKAIMKKTAQNRNSLINQGV